MQRYTNKSNNPRKKIKEGYFFTLSKQEVLSNTISIFCLKTYRQKCFKASQTLSSIACVTDLTEKINVLLSKVYKIASPLWTLNKFSSLTIIKSLFGNNWSRDDLMLRSSKVSIMLV